jgi:hypothetical protein
MRRLQAECGGLRCLEAECGGLRCLEAGYVFPGPRTALAALSRGYVFRPSLERCEKKVPLFHAPGKTYPASSHRWMRSLKDVAPETVSTNVSLV